jgi:hypothetical protein
MINYLKDNNCTCNILALNECIKNNYYSMIDELIIVSNLSSDAKIIFKNISDEIIIDKLINICKKDLIYYCPEYNKTNIFDYLLDKFNYTKDELKSLFEECIKHERYYMMERIYIKNKTIINEKIKIKTKNIDFICKILKIGVILDEETNIFLINNGRFDLIDYYEINIKNIDESKITNKRKYNDYINSI